MLKKYLLSYSYLLGIIIIITLIVSILNYFIPFKINLIKIITPIIAIFISSIILGKNSKQKAYLEGIKFVSIFIIITIILKILLKSTFNYKTFIIYLCLIISSILGGMIGINIKKE